MTVFGSSLGVGQIVELVSPNGNLQSVLEPDVLQATLPVPEDLVSNPSVVTDWGPVMMALNALYLTWGGSGRRTYTNLTTVSLLSGTTVQGQGSHIAPRGTAHVTFLCNNVTDVDIRDWTVDGDSTFGEQAGPPYFNSVVQGLSSTRIRCTNILAKDWSIIGTRNRVLDFQECHDCWGFHCRGYISNAGAAGWGFTFTNGTTPLNYSRNGYFIACEISTFNDDVANGQWGGVAVDFSGYVEDSGIIGGRFAACVHGTLLGYDPKVMANLFIIGTQYYNCSATGVYLPSDLTDPIARQAGVIINGITTDFCGGGYSIGGGGIAGNWGNVNILGAQFRWTGYNPDGTLRKIENPAASLAQGDIFFGPSALGCSGTIGHTTHRNGCTFAMQIEVHRNLTVSDFTVQSDDNALVNWTSGVLFTKANLLNLPGAKLTIHDGCVELPTQAPSQGNQWKTGYWFQGGVVPLQVDAHNLAVNGKGAQGNAAVTIEYNVTGSITKVNATNLSYAYRLNETAFNNVQGGKLAVGGGGYLDTLSAVVFMPNNITTDTHWALFLGDNEQSVGAFAVSSFGQQALCKRATLLWPIREFIAPAAPLAAEFVAKVQDRVLLDTGASIKVCTTAPSTWKTLTPT